MGTVNLKKIASVVLAMAVFFSFTLAMTAEANAASSGTLKSTVYTGVIKNGNTVYCSTSAGIYKVKLKNQKVVKKTRLVKSYENNVVNTMKLKGNYLYYTCFYPVGEYMNRVNVKTGKEEEIFGPYKGRFKKCMSVSVLSYAFKGKKLYARINYGDGDEKDYKKTFVSKLNGKSPEKTSVKIKSTEKASNKKGYTIVEKGIETEDSYETKCYLKTPKGKFYLGKYAY